MRKKYIKPAIASEVINAAASQACDVAQARACVEGIWWVRLCPYPYKGLADENCPIPPDPQPYYS